LAISSIVDRDRWMQTLADEAHMLSGNTEHAVEQENEITVGCGGGAASRRQH